MTQLGLGRLTWAPNGKKLSTDFWAAGPQALSCIDIYNTDSQEIIRMPDAVNMFWSPYSSKATKALPTTAPSTSN